MAVGTRFLVLALAGALSFGPGALAQDDKDKSAESVAEPVAEPAPEPEPEPAGDPKYDSPTSGAVAAEEASSASEAPIGREVVVEDDPKPADAPIGREVVIERAPQPAATAVPVTESPKPPLPELPAAPVMADTPYPDCRDDYQQIADAFEKAEKTTECVAALDAWHAAVLVPHRQSMLDHQQAIAELYETQVQNNFEFSQIQRDGFFERVTAEHEASNLDGEHLAPYREALARYESDRAYLQERFCRYADNCPGWSPIAETAERDAADNLVTPTLQPGERSASRRSSDGNSCRTERAGGGLLGGILGGVIGDSTGLGALAGAIIGQAAGVLVAEIACQLSAEEQEQAVAATEEVLEDPEVGATSEWTSVTRSNVSGSSQVTALNSQPNGATCVDITDIVIIAGEETRVDKTMCREPGESRYTLQA